MQPFLALLPMTVFLLAAIPASSQELLACVNTKTGKIRMVASASKCNVKRETAVSWNVVGRQGNQGPEGPQGEEGPVGPSGPTMHLFDVNENDYGIFDITTLGEGFLFVEGGWLHISWDNDSASSGSEVFFPESLDCTGPGYRLEGQGGSGLLGFNGIWSAPGVTGSDARYFRDGDRTLNFLQGEGSKLAAGCQPVVLETSNYLPVVEVTSDVLPRVFPLPLPVTIRPSP